MCPFVLIILTLYLRLYLLFVSLVWNMTLNIKITMAPHRITVAVESVSWQQRSIKTNTSNTDSEPESKLIPLLDVSSGFSTKCNRQSHRLHRSMCCADVPRGAVVHSSVDTLFTPTCTFDSHQRTRSILTESWTFVANSSARRVLCPFKPWSTSTVSQLTPSVSKWAGHHCFIPFSHVQQFAGPRPPGHISLSPGTCCLTYWRIWIVRTWARLPWISALLCSTVKLKSITF